MDSEEINKRLEAGELLFCPECDLYYEESGTCLIITCSNPFKGASDLDIEAHGEIIKKNFNEFYKINQNTEKGGDKIG